MFKGNSSIAIMDVHSIDIDRRDPNNLNDHLQVSWDDIFGEPDGIRSTDCVWSCSYKCYRTSKNCCYRVLTFLFAPILALFMGCQFACLAFEHIWCVVPCLRCVKINCAIFRDLSTIILSGLCGPCVEICALYFSKIKVRYQRLPDLQKEIDPMTV